jgi:hypothetical protein
MPSCPVARAIHVSKEFILKVGSPICIFASVKYALNFLSRVSDIAEVGSVELEGLVSHIASIKNVVHSLAMNESAAGKDSLHLRIATR